MNETFRRIDPAEPPAGGMYHLLNAAIAPRPIAWVATLAADGTPNVAPHSYTTILSPNPPILGFVSIGRKDTLRNVEALPELVYHVADIALAERLNRTAADFPSDVSEFAWAGLTPLPSERVAVPRIAEAPVAFEANVVDIVRVRETENFLVMAEVLLGHIAERLFDVDRIDPARLQPIGRLAGSQFSRLGELFSLVRPTYRGLIESGTEPFEPKM
jgi:flavin reductase (DIM6/NTAB) family NADH-FMN oxidoreductase RutF